MSTTVPSTTPDALATQLRWGSSGHMEDVAVRLLLWQRRDLWAGPAVRRYILHWERGGKPAARILWSRLADAARRDMPPMPFDLDERRMIAVACSLGGAAPISLNDALNVRGYAARLTLGHLLREALHMPEVTP